MICPKCGYSTYDHASARREPFSRNVVVCVGEAKCALTESQALLAAQRHAAAVELWHGAHAQILEFGIEYTIEFGMINSIHFYQKALRDCGIQRPRGNKR